MRNLLDGKQSIACRCPIQNKDERYTKAWSDEDWMEWQANGIAPRILMPKQTINAAVEKMLAESLSNPFIAAGIMKPAEWIVEQLADFYCVSKVSVVIRLKELGVTISKA
jgi:Zn-dependent peptidase ImmA (M78 family)